MKKTIRWSLFAMMALMLMGCGATPESAKPSSSVSCETDEDCGFDVCLANKIRQVECVEGSCKAAEAQCEGKKVCVQDSTGTRCEDAIPTPPLEKPILSCHRNSNQIQMTGINAFNNMWFACGSDCPPDYACDAITCLCEKSKAGKQSCKDEPLFVYGSDTTGVQGIKDHYKTLNLDELDQLGAGEKTEFIEDGKKVVIPAYNRGKKYFPFPQKQFIATPPSPNHVPCANEYYGGVVGMDIHRVLVNSPGDCDFGPTGVMDGYLLACAEDVFIWYDSWSSIYKALGEFFGNLLKKD